MSLKKKLGSFVAASSKPPKSMIIFYLFQAVLSLHNMGVATLPRPVGMVRLGGWKVRMRQVNGQDGHTQTHASAYSQAHMHEQKYG